MDRYEKERQIKLKKIYKAMNKKPYEEKEDWEKFLNDDRSYYKKKQKEIWKNEILIESDKLDYFTDK